MTPYTASLTLALVSGLLLAGASACTTPTIQSVEHVKAVIDPTLAPDHKERLMERNRIVLDRPGAWFDVRGHGTCGAIRVRFGDGTSQEIRSANLDTTVEVAHTYSGWGGPKKVTAETVTDCVGRATTEVTVEPTFKAIGLAAGQATACNAVPGVPPIRAGSRVSIGDASNGQSKIRFSVFLERGIDGSPEVALGPPFTFPFPGLKAHSLVLRIAAANGAVQIEQGGAGKSFVVARTGPLELCINDDSLLGNTGAWGVAIAVDERGAEP